MRSESIVFAIAGMCFGVILGWVIGTQQASRRSATQAQLQPSATAAAPAESGTAPQGAPASRRRSTRASVQSLMTIIKSDPKNAGAHLQLANTYFDAERYSDAIKWYEEALKLDPKNADASTDLGVSYYYSGRTDDALKQFEFSLKINPKHAKTLFNKGIVLAFGKRDLQGATDAWQQVVQLAPGHPRSAGRPAGTAGNCRRARPRASTGADTWTIRWMRRARQAPRDHRSAARHPRRVAHGRRHDCDLRRGAPRGPREPGRQARARPVCGTTCPPDSALSGATITSARERAATIRNTSAAPSVA